MGVKGRDEVLTAAVRKSATNRREFLKSTGRGADDPWGGDRTTPRRSWRDRALDVIRFWIFKIRSSSLTIVPMSTRSPTDDQGDDHGDSHTRCRCAGRGGHRNGFGSGACRFGGRCRLRVPEHQRLQPGQRAPPRQRSLQRPRHRHPRIRQHHQLTRLLRIPPRRNRLDNDPHPVVIGDVIHPSVCVDGRTPPSATPAPSPKPSPPTAPSKSDSPSAANATGTSTGPPSRRRVFTSTNDFNRANGFPHVNEVSKGLGTVTLEFVNTTNSLAVFEYRIDGTVGQRPPPRRHRRRHPPQRLRRRTHPTRLRHQPRHPNLHRQQPRRSPTRPRRRTRLGLRLDPLHRRPAGPTSKRDCKRGGWEAFGFRNQGQCIKSVNNAGDRPYEDHKEDPRRPQGSRRPQGAKATTAAKAAAADSLIDQQRWTRSVTVARQLKCKAMAGWSAQTLGQASTKQSHERSISSRAANGGRLVPRALRPLRAWLTRWTCLDRHCSRSTECLGRSSWCDVGTHRHSPLSGLAAPTGTQ